MLRRAETADLGAIQALIRAFPQQLLDRGEGFLADLAADPDSRLLVCHAWSMLRREWQARP